MDFIVKVYDDSLNGNYGGEGGFVALGFSWLTCGATLPAIAWTD